MVSRMATRNAFEVQSWILIFSVVTLTLFRSWDRQGWLRSVLNVSLSVRKVPDFHHNNLWQFWSGTKRQVVAVTHRPRFLSNKFYSYFFIADVPLRITKFLIHLWISSFSFISNSHYLLRSWMKRISHLRWNKHYLVSLDWQSGHFFL